MTPDEVLAKLKEISSNKTRRTLDVIYEICREQIDRGHYDFSVATIARLGRGRGVPRAQSLRNRTGEKYRALLKSFEKDAPQQTRNRAQIGESDWIEEIENSKHKLLARMQSEELYAAKKMLRDFIPPGTRIEVKDYQNMAYESEGCLNSIERRALEYLTSSDFLGKWHFTISEYGEIRDQDGKVVLKAGTVDAVKKALTYL